MRHILIAALASCADESVKVVLYRFLVGLSLDELEFIAGFLGGCILDSEAWSSGSEDPCECVSQSHLQREDQDHKMILLMEYLCRGGTERVAAGRA